MKLKTADLTGPALDWAVAKSAYPNHMRYNAGVVQIKNLDALLSFEPSTDWATGGPIIEDKGITVHRNSKLLWSDDERRWEAHRTMGIDLPPPRHATGRVYGPTLLIAAMRCYVTSQLGTEVDIPEELCQ